MSNSTVVAGPGAAATLDRWGGAEWPRVGSAVVDMDARDAGAGALSTEARLLAEATGLPIAAPAPVAGTDREAMRQYVRALNDLIVGPGPNSPTLRLLHGRVTPDALAGLGAADLRLALAPLWDADELDVLERLTPAELEAEWRRRAAERLPRAAAVVRDGVDNAAFWKDMPGGDFDTGGRGVDYTDGMRAFPACRALGVQALLELLGAFEPGPRVYLDVLGGEGYVWRLLEAQRQLAERQVVAAPDGAFDGGPLPAVLGDLLTRTARADPNAVIMAVDAPDGVDTCAGRLLALEEGRVRVSEPFPVSGADVVEWLRRGPGPAPDAERGPAARALADMVRARGRRGTPVMITNDVSRHMFYRAGLWGMPTREDALRMSRTFRPQSLDGVLCAYGTHHIPDIPAALRESFEILKPGGRMVVHDFFDRGPVGNWFHDVVDPYSKTGHDMPHLGPVEMAVHLFRAGFRQVELMEIDDPFVFSAEPGDAMDAREVALRYTMGMYGMTLKFADALDELEGYVRRVLDYPELGDSAVFDANFAYIPRRAVVAVARKPQPGDAAAFSPADAALVGALAEAFRASEGALRQRSGAPAAATRHWFGAEGERWGVSARDQREFLAWERAQRAAGVLS